MQQRTPSILIIGAGMAGIICARELMAAGQSVALIDKGRQAGGRMATRSSRTSPSSQFDHGAQYFTARSPEFKAEVDKWMSDGLLKEWSPKLMSFEKGEWVRCSPDHRRFVPIPKMSAFPDALAKGLNIRQGERAVALKGRPGYYSCFLESGEAIEGVERVIVNAPPPQASALLAPLAPALADSIAAVVMSPCWALMLEFSSPLPLNFDAAFINHGPIAWIARDSAKPGRPPGERWVIHATPEWSTTNLEETQDYAATALLEALRERLELEDLKPDSAVAHRWRYAQSGSNMTPGSHWDPELGLGACGDWCEGGRVEGAYLSGLRLAKAILKDL